MILIDQTEKMDYSSCYKAAKLRIALVLLVVTGIRINEPLPLKICQFKTLFAESWISIDCSKLGRASYKVFLTHHGKKLIQARGKNF